VERRKRTPFVVLRRGHQGGQVSSTIGRGRTHTDAGYAMVLAMRDTLVLTIIGPDRTGLVESVSDRIASHGGNWEESRMARLAGQFAGILLVTIDAARTDQLLSSLRALESAGLQVTVQPTARATPAPGTSVRLQVNGQDRPGIIRDVSRVLAERGINVEELDSEVKSAAMSGEHMFWARARLFAPADVDLADLRARLERLSGELMVDLAVE
jgi:glycine cleavage system regulatory protein